MASLTWWVAVRKREGKEWCQKKEGKSLWGVIFKLRSEGWEDLVMWRNLEEHDLDRGSRKNKLSGAGRGFCVQHDWQHRVSLEIEVGTGLKQNVWSQGMDPGFNDHKSSSSAMSSEKPACLLLPTLLLISLNSSTFPPVPLLFCFFSLLPLQ